MSYSHHFTGRVVRSLLAGRAYRSTFKVFASMDQYTDFQSMSTLRGPSKDFGFLLGAAEKIDLLDKVVTAAFAELNPLDFCLMTSKQPGTVPLTERQLRADVFLSVDLNQERARLLAAGKSFLTIRELFVRHPMECGDNSIHIEWITPTRQLEKFHSFSSLLNEYGIAPIENHVSD